jgi:hypothetical protein
MYFNTDASEHHGLKIKVDPLRFMVSDSLGYSQYVLSIDHQVE